jgi:uncharacterized protein YndB with AHSA1/START domain
MTVKESIVIDAPIDKVWQAVTDQRLINEWGGGPASMSDKEGALFSLWDGDVHGTNTKVVVEQLIDQDWFSREPWSKPSKVSLHFIADGNKTMFLIQHGDVPDDAAESVAKGWQKYYLEPIKQLLEKK